MIGCSDANMLLGKFKPVSEHLFRERNSLVKDCLTKFFIGIKHAFMKCQANVLTRQARRAYLKLRSDVLVAQQYIKRFHAMLWYKRIKESKEGLETHIE